MVTETNDWISERRWIELAQDHEPSGYAATLLVSQSDLRVEHINNWNGIT
jgi:hypothetical protein